MTCVQEVKTVNNLIDTEAEVKMVNYYQDAVNEVLRDDKASSNKMVRCSSREESGSKVQEMVEYITGNTVKATAAYKDDKLTVLSVCESGKRMVTSVKVIESPEQDRVIPVVEQRIVGKDEFKGHVILCLRLVQAWNRYIQRINYVESE